MTKTKQLSVQKSNLKTPYMSSQDLLTPLDSHDTEYHLEFLERIESDLEKDKTSLKKARIQAKKIIERSRVKKMKTLNITK